MPQAPSLSFGTETAKQTAMRAVATLVLLVAATAAQNECQNPTTTSEKNTCFDAIRSAAYDQSRYWFGTEFLQKCQLSTTPPINCIPTFSPIPAGYSLADLLFPDPTGALDALSQIVDVTFTSPAVGEYKGCEHDYVVSAPVTRQPYPLSEQSYPAWDTQNMPEVTWSSEPGVQYTLLMIEAGFGVLHGAWININDGDVNNGIELSPFKIHGFFIVGKINVFTFLLYEQTTNDITADSSWLQVDSSGRFNLTRLTEPDALNLTVPIGINWLLTSPDGFSVNRAWDDGLAMNCAELVRVEFVQQGQMFVDITDDYLLFFVNVTFHSPTISYQACCETNTFDEEELVLDSIGSGQFPAIQVQAGTPFSINVIQNYFIALSSSDYTGRNFTLMIVDPDLTLASVGTPERPYLHGLYTNLAIDGGALDLTSGNVVATYASPLPPDQTPHQYFFVVFEQQYPLELNTTTAYTGADCSESLRTRCLFNVSQFIVENDLDVVGMSWMSVGNDDWVNLQYGLSESAFCAGRTEYSDPCPAGAPKWRISNVFALFFLLQLSYYI